MPSKATEFHGFSGPGCEEESWSPEVLTFYGDSDAIVRKLEKFEMNLPGRRVFFFSLEKDQEEEIVFFERASKDTHNVYTWKGKHSSKLADNIAHAILANKGIACVGEQTKAILKKLSNFKPEGPIPSPVSARAAFSHQIMAGKDSYMKVSAYLMC
ncbi:hypothetical protein HFN47_18995 [Rhizobium leguminosarum]|nr:hypothetical protein [Rhizobium leguminosarum]MBY5859919.1 hypothetical protein [Rhizobium leguminosarum]